MSQRNEEMFQQRLAKSNRLRASGVDPYPARSARSHTTAEAQAAFTAIETGTQDAAAQFSVCGRIRLSRPMGKKVTFMDLQDGAGQLQVYCKQEVLGEHDFALLAELDLGDFVQASGRLFRTRTGEVTLEARHLLVLTKSLQPPPEKWHGVSDIELKYRQRYLDLMSSEEARLRFRRRSQIVSAIRRFMDERGFIEVETPVLQEEAGGVGGFDRVYEIGRIFRNEGIDTRHNPEFTMMESYEAFADYHDVARMVEALVGSIAREVLGTDVIASGEGTLSLAGPWQRLTMRDALIEYAGIDFEQYRDESSLRAWMAENHIHAAPDFGWGKLIDEVFSQRVQMHLQQPVFLMDYPIELSPLAKRKVDDPALVERFEAFIGGFEIANAYSELNDPIDQRERFAGQVAARERGDEETELIDEDFIAALEHGMPPAGGLGIGIDRLCMILLNEPSIREVILFPQLRALNRTEQSLSEPGG